MKNFKFKIIGILMLLYYALLSITLFITQIIMWIVLFLLYSINELKKYIFKKFKKDA
jgi:hypothetical protein